METWSVYFQGNVKVYRVRGGNPTEHSYCVSLGTRDSQPCLRLEGQGLGTSKLINVSFSALEYCNGGVINYFSGACNYYASGPRILLCLARVLLTPTLVLVSETVSLSFHDQTPGSVAFTHLTLTLHSQLTLTDQHWNETKVVIIDLPGCP